MMRTSFQMLKAYRECPQRYKFIYLDHLQDKFQQVKPQFVMGQHMHTTLKKLLADVPADERTSEKAGALLRQVWKSNRTGFADRKEEADYGKEALGMLDTFLASPLRAQPRYLEHSIQLVISRDVMLVGRVDRLDQDSGGAVHLIDYKTSKYNPMYIDKSQLTIYSVLVTGGLELPLVSASLWYLGENKFVTYVPTQSDMETVVDEIIRTAELIKSNTSFAPTPSHVCKWCEFIDICPAKTEAYAIRDKSTDSVE